MSAAKARRLAAAEAEVAALRAERDRQERRADRFRAFVKSQALTAHALGAGDWERRMLDELHRDDRSVAALAADSPEPERPTKPYFPTVADQLAPLSGEPSPPQPQRRSSLKAGPVPSVAPEPEEKP